MYDNTKTFTINGQIEGFGGFHLNHLALIQPFNGYGVVSRPKFLGEECNNTYLELIGPALLRNSLSPTVSTLNPTDEPTTTTNSPTDITLHPTNISK